MSWFSVIKENRLVSENITHTKVNEQDPEQDKEDKCKKALIKFVELMDAYLDALGSKYFNWQFDVHKCIKIIESFPERRCCQILEKLRGIKNKSNPEAVNEIHYGYVGQYFMMKVENKDYIEQKVRERQIHGKTIPKDDYGLQHLIFFGIVSEDGSAVSIHSTEHALGRFSLTDRADRELSKYIEDTWKRVFDTIMGMIP